MNARTSLHVVSTSGPSSKSDPQTERLGYFAVGAGAPIVMLHSSLSSKAQWAALAERLAPRFRVIAIDLCGYGDNPLPASTKFTLDEEVWLVRDLLDDLVGTLTRVHFVGHSYGGLVALRYARDYAERVASLSLFEPVVFGALDANGPEMSMTNQCAERVSQLVAAGRRREAAQAFVDFWSGHGTYASMPFPAQVSMARRIDKVPLDFQAALSWPQDPDELRAIVAPTLLLGGWRSPDPAQRIHTRLAQTLTNRRVGSFDCGHMGPVTHPQRINPWIDAFVELCSQSGAGAPAAHNATSTTAALTTPARWMV